MHKAPKVKSFRFQNMQRMKHHFLIARETEPQSENKERIFNIYFLLNNLHLKKDSIIKNHWVG